MIKLNNETKALSNRIRHYLNDNPEIMNESCVYDDIIWQVVVSGPNSPVAALLEDYQIKTEVGIQEIVAIPKLQLKDVERVMSGDLEPLSKVIKTGNAVLLEAFSLNNIDPDTFTTPTYKFQSFTIKFGCGTSMSSDQFYRTFNIPEYTLGDYCNYCEYTNLYKLKLYTSRKPLQLVEENG